WLTGSACWNFVAVSSWILGIRPDYEGLIIDPCIPKEWKGFEVKRHFRGVDYYITVRNPQGVSKGIQSITLDGRKLETNIIPPQNPDSKNEHHVEVILGKSK
ncbi:MAG: glycosyl hydrolase family 65 protein, partial [bacterium]